MSKKTNIRYNWGKIQEDYDSGLSTRDLSNKYGMSLAALHYAVKTKKLKTRTRVQGLSLRNRSFPRKHTEETKQKISKARIVYLTKNPNKVPYRLYHSSNRSYFELLFEKALNDANITGWISAYQAGIYEYDFAFTDLKIDVEIDGNTHLQENVKKIDQRRDEWTKNNGWIVVRFSATRIKKDLENCINVLQELIQNRQAIIAQLVAATNS